MSAHPVNNIHDKLFKYIFKRKEAAIGLLENYLPEKVAEHIAWETLDIESGSYVDEHWRDRYSDVVFSVQAHCQELKLYLLFEHQSSPDHFMAVRFLSYRNNLWEQIRASDPQLKRLPRVIPVLLYQGDKAWGSGNRLADVLKAAGELEEDLQVFDGDFQYVLIDLPSLSQEAIKGHIIGRVAMILMKANRAGCIWEAVSEIEPLLAEISHAENSADLIRRFLFYIFESDSRIDKQGFQNKLESLKDKQLQESAMSIAEVLRTEGKAEGRAEGILIGEICQCQKLLGLPVSLENDLLLNSLSELEKLHQELEAEIRKRFSQ